ncbi:hypothetical protein [Brevundimonas nasdae]|uniref:hypothetical protein n=1 Tax=Brevundimonas nasdae TaxID=172043 RepID=UPI003F690B6D
MAKISILPPAEVLNGNETLPIIQDGESRKAVVDDLKPIFQPIADEARDEALAAVQQLQLPVPTIPPWQDLTIDALQRPVRGRQTDGSHWEARGGQMVQVSNVALLSDDGITPAYPRLAVTEALLLPPMPGVGRLYPGVANWRELVVDALNRPVYGVTQAGVAYRASGGILLREGALGQDLKQTWSYDRMTGTAVHAASDLVDYGILIVGQSLAEGASQVATDVALTTAPEHPGAALMPAGHVFPAGQAFASYQDLREIKKSDGGTKETTASGMADGLMRRLTASLGFKPRVVFAVAARGGNPYYGSATDANGGLKRGSATYAEALRIVRQCKSISAAAGRTFIVAGVVAIHGEQDHTDGRAKGLYRRAVSQWSSTLGDDIRAITGQSDRVRWYLTQVNRGNGARVEPVIAQAQLESQDRDPNVRMVGPIYFGDQSGDNSHPSPRAYRRMGQMIGSALADDLFGPYFQALFIRDAWWVSSTVLRARFTMPVAIEVTDDLVVVSTLGAGKGLTFADGSGSPPNISGLSIVSGAPDTIEITLSAPPAGKRPQIFVATAASGGPGRVTGCRSGIRSATSFTTDPQDSAVLYHWACQQAVDLPVI